MINPAPDSKDIPSVGSSRTRTRRGSPRAEAIDAGHLEIEGHRMVAEARRLEASVKHWEASLHEKKPRHGAKRTGQEHERPAGRRGNRPAEIEIDIIDLPEAAFDETAAAEPIAEEVRLIAEEAEALNHRRRTRRSKRARKGKKAPSK